MSEGESKIKTEGGGNKSNTGRKASVLHARVHGEVRDIQQAAHAECIYDARGRQQIVCEILHPSLVLLLMMLMLLLLPSSFVLPCSYINDQIYSAFPFAHHQLIY